MCVYISEIEYIQWQMNLTVLQITESPDGFQEETN